LARKTMRLTRKGDKEMYPGIPEIIHESSRFAKGDALKDQIEDFLQCIITNTPPLVSGEDGKQALETAIKITDMIHANNKQFPLTQDLPY
jgi:predicted dehydrogenase